MLPKQTGISGVRQVYGDEAGGAPLRKLRTGSTLTELQQDYTLFNFAPLFLYGGLDFNPVHEWINLYNTPQEVYVFPLEAPILNMGGVAPWENILWAVAKEHWASLSLHLGTLALLDRMHNRLTRTICQAISVIDCAAINKVQITDKVPTVLIYTFGVDANDRCLVFLPANNLLVDRPVLKRMPPLDETRKLAAALFTNQSDPYKNIQPKPWELNEDSHPTST